MTFKFMRRERSQIVLDEIDSANQGLNAADRERKFRKMSASPYKFFRGTNHLYWSDVWRDWRYHLFGGLAETQTWLQGDAHVYNHGAYGDDRQGLHYGMDDFDDSVIADYQFDLWRHASSMVMDASENVGLPKDETRRAIRHFLDSYLETIEHYQDGRSVDDIHVSYLKQPLGDFMKKVKKKQGPEKYLAKWTVVEDGERRFNTERRKMGEVSTRDRNRIEKALREDYFQTLGTQSGEPTRAHFEVKDIAQRLDAGIGSLGLLRYYALVEGASTGQDDDVILDIKEQTGPAAYRCMNPNEKRAWTNSYTNEAERHAQAFDALANHTDEYLGWLTLGKKPFSVRERSPYKKDFPTHKVKKFKQYRQLTRQWGRIMAREHIRGARALRPDEPGYFCKAVLGRMENNRETFKNQVVNLAFTYARCAEQDYRLFVAERGYKDEQD